ncbi:hypothetical protein [Streptomyces sp. NPDC088812]|uniref:hypothetical protein n=1 Tax=Streptomyces sp. NPDC088812 TaxID=3365905 RepID=UPI0038119C1F
MGSFTTDDILIVVCVIGVVALGLIVLGLRRGSLKRASLRGMGAKAEFEGHREAEPLRGQTVQADDLKVTKSSLRMVRSARAIFKRTRFKKSVFEILPDDGSPLRRPTDPPPPQAGADGR